jgi:hypothetical protein
MGSVWQWPYLIMEVINRQEAKERGLKDFFTNVPCKRGHLEVRSVANGTCRRCARDATNERRRLNPELDRQNSREWYAKNKEHAKAWKENWVANNREKFYERRKRYRSQIETRAKELFRMAKFNAKKKNVPFDLDYEWVFENLQKGVCQMTGLKFILEPLPKGRQNPYTASLDRITPELGYVKSNVRMILWALNAAFNSYGEHVYASIAKVFLEKNPDIGTQTS